MHFAINLPNFGTFASATVVARLAAEAEASGWDGCFVWDHILTGDDPVGDPWVQLAAAAVATQRIKLGTMITPLPRRRPWKLAREAVTLDHLSDGRLILGLGAGDDAYGELSSFGEPTDARQRAAMLDEGLEVLTRLWSGERFSFEGKHYQVRDVRFLPVPLQQPRIPIWIAARWPSKTPFRRAARWDGVAAISGSNGALSPEDCRAILDFVKEHRLPSEPFDLTIVGWTHGSGEELAPDRSAVYAEAGVTWFQVSFEPDTPVEKASDFIRRGPPK